MSAGSDIRSEPRIETIPKSEDISWYSIPLSSVESELRSDKSAGLKESEAMERLTRFGPNSMDDGKEPSFLKEVVEELTEPMILLLLVVGVLYSILGEPLDAATIFVVIVALICVEAYNDYRAGKTIKSLRKLSEPNAIVKRAGIAQEIPAAAIVPGDLVRLQSGNRVPADARIIGSFGLVIDESLLTGESAQVEKGVEDTLPQGTVLAERRNMVFAGSVVMRGRGEVLVVETGARTELGRIASLARGQRPPKTILQLAMRDLTRWMVVVALGFSILVPLLGVLLSHEPWETMVLTGLSLAFATIPEELPIIITMVLALGGYRLSKQRAIVKRLQAVETLGAVTVIATDKTGTLTKNRMEVVHLYPRANSDRVLTIGVLCSDAVRTPQGILGDPTERGLLEAAGASGIDLDGLERRWKLRGEYSFDAMRKRMSTVLIGQEGLLVATKGALESLLEICSSILSEGVVRPLQPEDRADLIDEAERSGRQGCRVLAMAEKQLESPPADQDEAERGLTFIGLVALRDPPRPEVKQAIALSAQAGIRTIMITGDQLSTAVSVAREVGLDKGERTLTGQDLESLDDEGLVSCLAEVKVFARTTPEQKLRIVKALRARGERIAVTGDGINDAPALAAADIGIAMGERGSDVARDAADIVLADDDYSTIIGAIQEGRKLFANLSKGVKYYLACKVALIGVTLLAVLLLAPVPFSPIQIILLELFMDLGASAAFAAERAEGDIMAQPPRDPRRPFLDRGMVRGIFLSSAGLLVAVGIAYLLTWEQTGSLAQAQTMAFVTWLMGHFLLALNLRSDREPMLRMGLTSNRIMLAWGLGALLFAILATELPLLQEALKTTYLTPGQWGTAVLLSVAFTFWIELYKMATYGRQHAAS
jgi:Ca2+-transporting ATPase